MFEAEDTGPKLWLNELLVTKSIAKREYQKHNYEKAAQYCEKVLNVSSNDLDTRILMSKCQQNIIQPKLAEKHQFLAENQSPTSLLVLENGANLLIDDDEFELSLLTYLNGFRKRTLPTVFNFGFLTASQIIEESTVLNKTKYRKNCLGNTVLKLAKQGDLEFVPDVDKILSKNKLTTKRNSSFYLGDLAQDRKYFDKILKSSRPKCPFYVTEKKIQDNMRHVIIASDVAEDQLYKRKRLYVHKCEVNKFRGERLTTQKNHYKIIKTMRHIQIARYINTIIQLIMNNEIKDAVQKTNLMIKFMEKIMYNDSIIILDMIYRSFGVAQYLLFQDLDSWNKERNHDRMLILLGATKNFNDVPLQESILGPYDSNPKVTISTLQSRMKKSKSIIEKLYLNFEIAKCYIRLRGPHNLVEARNKASDCFHLAETNNSYTWLANSLILVAAIEFQLLSKRRSRIALIKVAEIAYKLQVPGVTMFLKKMSKIIFEVHTVDKTPNEQRQEQIVNFMPDIKTRMEALFVFRRLNTMPVNRQMSLVAGVILKHNNSKYSSARAAHKYLTIGHQGSQQRRLGIPDFMLQDHIQLTVNLDN